MCSVLEKIPGPQPLLLSHVRVPCGPPCVANHRTVRERVTILILEWDQDSYIESHNLYIHIYIYTFICTYTHIHTYIYIYNTTDSAKMWMPKIYRSPSPKAKSTSKMLSSKPQPSMICNCPLLSKAAWYKHKTANDNVAPHACPLTNVDLPEENICKSTSVR